MARRRVSIFERRFSYGKVGTWRRSSSKAELMEVQLEIKLSDGRYIFLSFMIYDRNNKFKK